MQRHSSPENHAVAFATIPMLGTLLGVLIDERRHLGFTNWQAACLAEGPSLRTILVFTRELLPSAIVGMLAGALLVVLIGLLARRTNAARACLAAHLGCAVTMPLMLLICLFAPSPAVMLIADVAFAALAAILILRIFSRRPRTPAAHP